MEAPVDTLGINTENLKPAELLALVELQGAILFDSVGNFPSNYQVPLSILAISPSKVYRGHISNVQELESLLREDSPSQDLGYPTGGLAGWVDYDGHYTFGYYERFWVYNEESEEWIQYGNEPVLSSATKQVVPEMGPWAAKTSRQEYVSAVSQAQEYIAAGHIYQVNLAQRFSTVMEEAVDLYPLYQRLREESPAPMACYGQLGQVELLCSSPETFLKMSSQLVETRPIKGTSPRFADPEQDNLSAYQLMSSEKEKAELLMITDLLRNDLGQVCEYGSVMVDELLSVEKLEQVYHMVSTVKGTLRDEVSHLQVLQRCLPGGSITGAPKLRAMQVIDELEPCKRGLYTGVAGYLGHNGESQFNIIIRSLIREGDQIHYHVGAGIVADSVPEKEYEETLVKAEGIRRALAT